MQEIKKSRIVLASVLKPVNDPRMFEKMGQSLADDYEVHIIGTSGTVTSTEKEVFFHPLSIYKRLSLSRILTPLRVLTKILQLKPALVIISTHELLWIALVAKAMVRCRVIYDVRENYFRNILYTNAFPPGARELIAIYVRMKEWITAPFINLFFLAEAGYQIEMSFIGRKKVIIENKLKKLHLPSKQKWSALDQHLHLLFSGTLAKTTGVFIAIDIATKLHAIDSTIKLHIVGFSPMPAVQREINEAIATKHFISFNSSSEPISHLDILNAIQQADAGIIAYPPNFSTENTIPTKLFEYLGHKLPMLLINHLPWVEICKPYPAAIPFDISGFNIEEILTSLRNTRFYVRTPLDVYWEGEEEKLLQTIAAVLK